MPMFFLNKVIELKNFFMCNLYWPSGVAAFANRHSMKLLLAY